MFIFKDKEPLNNVLLLLSTKEAIELKDALEQLLVSDNNHHKHISTDDYQKEITISIIDKNPIETYAPHIRDAIENRFS